MPLQLLPEMPLAIEYRTPVLGISDQRLGRGLVSEIGKVPGMKDWGTPGNDLGSEVGKGSGTKGHGNSPPPPVD